MRSMLWLLACAVVPWVVVSAAAEPAPSTESLPTGVFLQHVRCRADSSETYSLYLPTSFTPRRRWPALLVFDPRGRSVAAAERFREAAETYGWIILSADGTRSDGPWEPNRRAMEALWPEVHERYSVEPSRVYAAGFSGGAIVAWYLAQFGTPALAGVIASGGRQAQEIPVGSIAFAHFGAAGSADFNYSEMKRLDALVAQRRAPHQFRVFPGRHQWLPEVLATESIEWMEVVAMQQGLRPRDSTLVETLFAKTVGAAAALAARGDKLAALRRYTTLVDTWNGLRDVGDARRVVESLRQDPETQQQMEEEQRADRFETEHLLRLSELLGDDVPLRRPRSEALHQELEIPQLRSMAAQESAEGQAARRLLEWIFTRTSFYMARERLRQGHEEEAKVLLHIALDIHPAASWVWFDLARAEARLGATQEAFFALRRALEEGFADLSRLDSDPDLDSLRGTAEYEHLLSTLPKASARDSTSKEPGFPRTRGHSSPHRFNEE